MVWKIAIPDKPVSLFILFFFSLEVLLPLPSRVQAATQYDLNYNIISPVYAKNGMVASEQALATKIGVDILKQGGNAV
ncbi:MAG: gamma-glutamyltransferase, partial [Verrucomicrobia bacterium]